MRKEEKKNLILMGLTAVCLLVIYLLLGWMQSRQSAQDDTTVYTLDQDAVVGLEYGSSDNTVKLVKKDNVWVYADDENFPLNQNFVETMVNKTTQLKARRRVASGKNAFQKYGLEMPSIVVQVKTADRVIKILLGDINSATGDCYMAVEGNEKVYTVDATFYTLFSNDIMAMASRESLPDMQMENVASFKIENDENTIEFQKKADGTWITSENTVADSGLITELFAKILKLRYEQMVVYQPGDEQLAEYGLDIPQTRLTINYTDAESSDKKSFELLISRVGPETDEEEKAARYVYSREGCGIYTIRESNLTDFFQIAPEDFLSLSVAPVKKDKFDTLTIETETGKIAFSIDRESDRNREIYRLNESEITEAEFNSVYYQLYAFAAERRVSDIADQLTRKPVLTYIYSNRADGEEKARVELIPYDQNYYGAKVNGKALLLVNRQKVNELLRKISEYMN